MYTLHPHEHEHVHNCMNMRKAIRITKLYQYTNWKNTRRVHSNIRFGMLALTLLHVLFRLHYNINIKRSKWHKIGNVVDSYELALILIISENSNIHTLHCTLAQRLMTFTLKDVHTAHSTCHTYECFTCLWCTSHNNSNNRHHNQIRIYIVSLSISLAALSFPPLFSGLEN